MSTGNVYSKAISKYKTLIVSLGATAGAGGAAAGGADADAGGAGGLAALFGELAGAA